MSSKKHITSAMSQIFGKFASREFSKPVQKFINTSYVNLMGLDMSEFKSADSYASLNALFTRKLNKQRPFSTLDSDFISPCDSLISECGKLDGEYALQIKGMRYKSDELLGEHFSKDEKAVVLNGDFINFYLSPRDYHRYHAPIDMQVLKVVHIPGKFYPVNVPSLKKRINLFVENERVVLQCQDKNGRTFYMILVSALNVGVMQVLFEPRIKTNSNALKSAAYIHENLWLAKGDDFGCFEMGSTIVVLSQEGMLETVVSAWEKVKFGQTIAKVL